MGGRDEAEVGGEDMAASSETGLFSYLRSASGGGGGGGAVGRWMAMASLRGGRALKIRASDHAASG